MLADLHFLAEVTEEEAENAAGEGQAAWKRWAQEILNVAFACRWLSRNRTPPPDPQPRSLRNADLIRSLVL